MQGTQVLSLVWEDPHASEELSLGAAVYEPVCARACVPHKRSHSSEKPIHCNEE